MGNSIRTAQFKFLTGDRATRNDMKQELEILASRYDYHSVGAMWLHTLANVKLKEGDYCNIICKEPMKIEIFYGGVIDGNYVRRYGHVVIGFKEKPYDYRDDPNRFKKLGKMKVLFHRKPNSKASRTKAFKINPELYRKQPEDDNEADTEVQPPDQYPPAADLQSLELQLA